MRRRPRQRHIRPSQANRSRGFRRGFTGVCRQRLVIVARFERYAKFPHCSDDQGAWQRMMIDAADFTALSLWALVSGHWSVWQAARFEVTQQAEAAERDANPVEHRVVASLIEATTVDAV